MAWVAVAVGGAALIGGVLQSNAAGSAANAQAGAAANAQQISQNEFNTITAQNQPFIQSGYGALSALDYGLGITPQTATGAAPNYGTPAGPDGAVPNWNNGSFTGGGLSNLSNLSNPWMSAHTSLGGYDPSSGYQIGPGGGISQLIPNPGMSSLGGARVPIQARPAPTPAAPQTGGLGFGSLTQPFNVSNWQQLSPAYNFQKQQGMQGVLNADTAGQGALSGAAMKDLIDYNQSAANTSFGTAFNQYQTQQGNIFSRLSGIAQLGQSAANNTGQQGTALAGQAAQSATNIGTAQAGGIVGSANAISGGISSAVPWLMANNNNPYSSDPFSFSLGGGGSVTSDPGYGG